VLATVGRLTPSSAPTGSWRPPRACRHGRAVVLLAGDGPELRPQLEQRARELGLDVRFLGWRADVERIYAAADLAVLASDNEGMPVALIEAALCARPAVATDVGSVREVVDHGAPAWSSTGTPLSCRRGDGPLLRRPRR
jgi:L-malate glycosyltransferase